jgi:hypothetical protein
MFRIKITPKRIKSEDNWGIAIDLPPHPQRIGIPGNLVDGDLIELETGGQYVVTGIRPVNPLAEEVSAYSLQPGHYIGRLETLVPGTRYMKVTSSLG